MTMTFVNRTDPEWDRMWAQVELFAGDCADYDPETGECWQYMGTVERTRPAIGSLLPLTIAVHQFRHRCRPANARPIDGAGDTRGKRVYLEIVAGHECAPHNYPLRGLYSVRALDNSAVACR